MRTSYLFSSIFAAALSFAVPLHALQWGELEQQIKSTIEGLHLGHHSVETKYADGELTVTGYVGSAAEKAKVVQALSSLKGITEVKDELEIKNGSAQGGSPADEAVRKDALDAVKRLSGLGSYELDVQPQNGEVVLNGSVTNPRDRNRIAEAVQSVAGVKNVTNHLEVAPPPSDSEVETNVWQALQKDTDLDVEGVTIKASNGVVTVQGTRSNHRQIDRILSIVNMADGVREVKSEMKIGK